jgi:hypothetical protein
MEKIILSNPTSIAPRLKELADQVAQMEVDKVAQVEREGWVRHDIVGAEPVEDDDGVSVGDDTSGDDYISGDEFTSDEDDTFDGDYW